MDYVLTVRLMDMGYSEGNPLWSVIPLWSKLVIGVGIALAVRRQKLLYYITLVMFLIVVWNMSILWMA